ncbi:MAG: biotin--[acetyl-CoA-carboxylase] ligase [Acidimicrobiales bacterium]
MLDDSARLALQDTRFADVRWCEEVESTNVTVAELARAGAPEGVVVVADHQTGGKGRQGRRWQAPAGSSLLLSVLLRPRLPQAQVPATTLSMALAASDACEQVTGIRPLVKWPNDLVVDDRKLGGILGESIVEGGQMAVVVGIGLNVNWATSPPAPGVALDELVGSSVDRNALLVALLRHLERRYQALGEPDGPATLLSDYRARSATLGRRVRVELWAGAVEGEAVDVTAEGHLVVDEGGRTRVIASGDVIHLRPF